MAPIQMTDYNPSDLEPMEELTDGELLAIKGGFSFLKPPPPKLPPDPPPPARLTFPPRPPFFR